MDLEGDHGYYYDSAWHAGAELGTTAAGDPYFNCRGVYYAPEYCGADLAYVVVENPEAGTRKHKVEAPTDA